MYNESAEQDNQKFKLQMRLYWEPYMNARWKTTA